MPGTLFGIHSYKAQDGEALNLTGGNITMCLCEWQLAVNQVVSVTHFYMTHPNKTCILINPEQGQRESQDVNPVQLCASQADELCTISLSVSNLSISMVLSPM